MATRSGLGKVSTTVPVNSTRCSIHGEIGRYEEMGLDRTRVPRVAVGVLDGAGVLPRADREPCTLN